jgi:DNA-binding LacI/PurR family transcriptional regulator
MPARMRKKRKRVTIEQLASQLKLSPATVSFVLNGKDREHRIAQATATRVREEAARLDYHPSAIARQLVGMKSNAVGVLINTQAIADPRLIQNMEMIAAERGVRFIVGHAVVTRQQVKAYLSDFRDRGVDGIISVFHSHPDYAETVLPELARFDNVVYFERPEDGLATTPAATCYVQPNYYEVGRLGVQHLLDRGRRRIATVFNDMAFPYSRARRRAYEDTLKAAGLPVDDRSIRLMDGQPGRHWSDRFDDRLALAGRRRSGGSRPSRRPGCRKRSRCRTPDRGPASPRPSRARRCSRCGLRRPRYWYADRPANHDSRPAHRPSGAGRGLDAV